LELRFRNRPWRGHYEVEFSYEKRVRQVACKKGETPEVNDGRDELLAEESEEEREEQEPSDPDELQWFIEQRLEKQRFKRDAKKLREIIKKETDADAQLVKNEIGEQFFDFDESDPDAE